MNIELSGRVALVTGGSKGIGLATAAALSDAGAKVCLLSRSQENLEKAQNQIRARNRAETSIYAGSVADGSACSGVVEQIMRQYGRLDILINNSGGPPMGSFLEQTDASWEAAFQAVLRAPIRFIQAAAPIMKQQKWGRIINITSFQAKEPTSNMVLSATLRAGLSTFSKAISGELAPAGITVNTVCPSAVLTDRMVALTRTAAEREDRAYEEILNDAQKTIPMGRFSRPEEIADLVVFLASERASYLTGTSIMIDGGITKSVF